MDRNPSFRFVWRFNAVMLCLAIVAVGMVGLADVAGRLATSTETMGTLSSFIDKHMLVA
jgi:hypothetical protein